MTDQINSTNLVPFRKRRGPYHIPGMTGGNEEHALDVDYNLEPEEERFIRHYLGYADTLLKIDVTEASEQEEVSAPKIPLAQISGVEVSSNEALSSDELNNGQFGNDHLDRENAIEAA